MSVTAGIESHLLTNSILFAVLMITFIFKRKYTWQGYLIFTLTFGAYVALTYFTLIPWTISIARISPKTKIWLPFYSGLELYLKGRVTIAHPIWLFAKHFLFAIPVALGAGLLCDTKKKFPNIIIGLNLYISFMELISALSGEGKVFDMGAILLLWLGSYIGLKFGRWIQKKQIFTLEPKEDADDFIT